MVIIIEEEERGVQNGMLVVRACILIVVCCSIHSQADSAYLEAVLIWRLRLNGDYRDMTLRLRDEE